ncbi:MAG: hypothetical protein KDI27_09505 [Gammaproteobacteria bacterium]|nr:hypothetical protein [Gammaproteobacteria bacterium]
MRVANPGLNNSHSQGSLRTVGSSLSLRSADLGYRAKDNLKCSVIVGVFDPGSAFAATANAAWLAELKLVYRF